MIQIGLRGQEKPPTQKRIGQPVTRIDQRLLTTSTTVPERPLPETGVNLGGSVKTHSPGLLLAQHQIPPGPLDLTERDNGIGSK
jgi:hypothetical protein